MAACLVRQIAGALVRTAGGVAAFGSGLELALFQASAMGRPIDERLGFRTVNERVVYAG